MSFPCVLRAFSLGSGLIIGPSIAQREPETETETETEIVQTLAGHKLICTDVANEKKKKHKVWPPIVSGQRETPAGEIRVKCNVPRAGSFPNELPSSPFRFNSMGFGRFDSIDSSGGVSNSVLGDC